jgi:CubicO group peptidase (beta-lactamase class C family)
LASDRIERLLRKAQQRKVFAGAALLVAAGGEVIYHRVVGHARTDPAPRLLARDTRFDLASVTKALATTTAVMLAVDDGRASLQEALGARLPLPAPLGRATPWHLLTHSSGLPAWRPLHEAWAAARAAGAVDGQRAAARRWLRGQVAQLPLEHRPGQTARYSDLGFMVLEWWLEEVFGRRVDHVLGERFFAPLACHHTGYVDLDDPPPVPRAGFAATERCPWRGQVMDGQVHDHNSWAMGGISGQAGLFSTTADVHRMLGALWRCWRGRPGPVSAATVRRFWLPSGVPGSSFRLGWDGPSATGYRSCGQYLGPATVGHLGFTGCSVWLDPDRGAWVVLLSNRVHPRADNPRLRALRPVLHDRVFQELRP